MSDSNRILVHRVGDPGRPARPSRDLPAGPSPAGFAPVSPPLRSGGNRAKAARLLDTTERVLNYKVRKYAIDVRRFTA